MKSSTFKLSNAQKTIFAIVLAMAFVISGCSEQSSITGSSDVEVDALQGRWQASDGSELLLERSRGTYQVPASQDASEMFMQFEYEKIDDNLIHIRVIQHVEDGQIMPTGEEQSVFYSREANTLRIFGKSFERAEEPSSDLDRYSSELNGIWTSEDGAAELSMSDARGSYVEKSNNGTVQLYKEFKYEQVDRHLLEITVTQLIENGETQPSGQQESVIYSLNENMLRIFDKTFVRNGSADLDRK